MTVDGPAAVRRQIDRLVALGYPALTGLGEVALRRRLAPLADVAAALPAAGPGRLPLVVVPGPGLLAASVAMGAVPGGVVDMRPTVPEEYATLAGAGVPGADAWLLVDIDPGMDLRDVTPDAALEVITGRGRRPLTIAEGVAVVTQHDGILRSATAFSLLASRRGDRRVPALWTTRGGATRLGWCWAGNPHTWLGSASCAARLSG